MICCILSKGRPETKTFKLFEAAKIKTFHFVEPQDLSAYKTQPNVIDIGANDKGISYVRNFILDWAKTNDEEWVIVCDDDITSFGFYDGKNHNSDAGIWLKIFEKIKEMPFEIVGINYRHHAWHEKTAFSVNRKFSECCVMLRVPGISWRYKDDTKEDRDFLLQTIKNGHGTIRFNRYFFSSPVVGTNKGGLHDNYANKRDTEWAVRMVQDWHPYAKLIKTKTGRIDARVDIKKFATDHKKVVK